MRCGAAGDGTQASGGRESGGGGGRGAPLPPLLSRPRPACLPTPPPTLRDGWPVPVRPAWGRQGREWRGGAGARRGAPPPHPHARPARPAEISGPLSRAASPAPRPPPAGPALGSRPPPGRGRVIALPARGGDRAVPPLTRRARRGGRQREEGQGQKKRQRERVRGRALPRGSRSRTPPPPHTPPHTPPPHPSPLPSLPHSQTTSTSWTPPRRVHDKSRPASPVARRRPSANM